MRCGYCGLSHPTRAEIRQCAAFFFLAKTELELISQMGDPQPE